MPYHREERAPFASERERSGAIPNYPVGGSFAGNRSDENNTIGSVSLP